MILSSWFPDSLLVLNQGQQKSIPDRLKTLATRLPAEPVQIGDFSDCSRFPDPLLDPNLGYPGNLEDSYPSGMVTTRRKSPYIITRGLGKPVFDLSG